MNVKNPRETSGVEKGREGKRAAQEGDDQAQECQEPEEEKGKLTFFHFSPLAVRS
jgi:hypothetical protein